MKSIRDSSGKLQFKPEELRTAQQMSNFLARMSTLQRQRQADEIESQEEKQEVTDEDLTALESEDHIPAIRQEVYRDIEQTISHPIQIEAVNVCELSRAGKLSSLKLTQFREVCRALSLQTNGSNSRKRTLLNHLMPTLSCAHVGNNCTTYSFAFYEIHCWVLSVLIDVTNTLKVEVTFSLCGLSSEK